jgi:hypothetical protein
MVPAIGISASQRGIIFVLSFLCVSLAGCGDGRPRRVPVSGKVLVDGKPLKYGFVRFFPDQARVSTGDIDSEGRFVLSCYGGEDGAVVGKHKVEVYATEGIDEERIRWHAPKRYANYSTSQLEHEITGPTDEITIKLSWGGGHPFVE